MISGVNRSPIGDEINPKKLRKPGIKNKNRFSSETYLEMAELSTKLSKDVIDSTRKITRSMVDSMEILTKKQKKQADEQNKSQVSVLKEIKQMLKENDKQAKKEQKEQDTVTRSLVKQMNDWSNKLGIDVEELMDQLWNQGELYEKLPDQLKNSVDEFTKVVAEKYGIQIKTAEEMNLFRKEYGNHLERIYLQTSLANDKSNSLLSKMLKGISSISFSLLEKPHKKMRSVFAPLALFTAPITDFLRSIDVPNKIAKKRSEAEDAKKQKELLDFRKLQRLQAQLLNWERTFDPEKQRKYGSLKSSKDRWEQHADKVLGREQPQPAPSIEKEEKPKKSSEDKSTVHGFSVLNELKILNSNFKKFSDFIISKESISTEKEKPAKKKGTVIDPKILDRLIFKNQRQYMSQVFDDLPEAMGRVSVPIELPLQDVVKSTRPTVTQVLKAGGLPSVWLYNNLKESFDTLPKLLTAGEDTGYSRKTEDDIVKFKRFTETQDKGFLKKLLPKVIKDIGPFSKEVSVIEDKRQVSFSPEDLLKISNKEATAKLSSEVTEKLSSFTKQLTLFPESKTLQYPEKTQAFLDEDSKNIFSKTVTSLSNKINTFTEKLPLLKEQPKIAIDEKPKLLTASENTDYSKKTDDDIFKFKRFTETQDKGFLKKLLPKVIKDIGPFSKEVSVIEDKRQASFSPEELLKISNKETVSTLSSEVIEKLSSFTKQLTLFPESKTLQYPEKTQAFLDEDSKNIFSKTVTSLSNKINTFTEKLPLLKEQPKIAIDEKPIFIKENKNTEIPKAIYDFSEKLNWFVNKVLIKNNKINLLEDQRKDTIDFTKLKESLVYPTPENPQDAFFREDSYFKDATEKLKTTKPNITQVAKSGGLSVIWLYNKIEKPVNAIPTILEQTKDLIAQNYKIAPNQKTTFLVEKKNNIVTKLLENVSIKISSLGQKFTSIKDVILSPIKNVQNKINNLKDKILHPIDTLKNSFSSVLKLPFLGSTRKKKKMNPSIRDVAKIGDLGSILIVRTLNKLLSKTPKRGEEKTSLLKKLFKDKNKKGKGLGFPALLGLLGGGLSIIEGLKGVVKGVGDTPGSSFIGGFLAGTDSQKSLKGMFKNAGRLALIGFSAGFGFGGIAGGITGGLIGAGIGAIAYILGPNVIASGIDKLKNLFSKNKKDNPFSSIQELIEKIKQIDITKINELVNNLNIFIVETLNPLAESINNFIQFVKNVKDTLTFSFNNTIEFIQNLTAPPTEAQVNEYKNLSVWERIFKSFEDAIQVYQANMKFKDKIGNWLYKYIELPIQNLFSGIGDFFSYIGAGINFADQAARISDIFTNNPKFLEYKQKKRTERQDEAALELIDIYSKNRSFFNISGKTPKEQTKIQGLEKLWNDNIKIFLKEPPTNINLFDDYQKQKDVAKNQLLNILSQMGIDTTHIQSVQDAIIKPNGNIIRTSPDDTIVATKNTPTIATNYINNNSESALTENNQYSSIAFDTTSLENKLGKKLDTIATILKQILDKDITLAPQPQTTMMLDNLIKGVF